jgi:hypothetical protein
MPERVSARSLTLVSLFGILVVAIVAIPFVGGESLIRGMGNSANRIYVDPVTDDVAEAIAESLAVPRVTDAELQAAFAAIRERARAGDLRSSLVLFRVADMQRAAEHD